MTSFSATRTDSFVLYPPSQDRSRSKCTTKREYDLLQTTRLQANDRPLSKFMMCNSEEGSPTGTFRSLTDIGNAYRAPDCISTVLA